MALSDGSRTIGKGAELLKYLIHKKSVTKRMVEKDFGVTGNTARRWLVELERVGCAQRITDHYRGSNEPDIYKAHL